MTSADRLAPSQGGPAEMFVRHPHNPIITAADLPRMVSTTLLRRRQKIASEPAISTANRTFSIHDASVIFSQL